MRYNYFGEIVIQQLLKLTIENKIEFFLFINGSVRQAYIFVNCAIWPIIDCSSCFEI